MNAIVSGLTPLSPIRNVGFIGLGDQGGPMARAIALAGFSLHLWARRPASLEALADVAHVPHSEASALAGACEMLSLCLNDDRDVWDVLNAQGMLRALKPGSLVVNHGTGDPNENRRIAAWLEAEGFDFLDAPVSGGRPAAVSRTLTTIVGGREESFRRGQPVFGTFSATCAYMGPAGSGQMTKLLNNALTMTNLKNAVDVFELAHRLNVDLKALYAVVRASSGSSRILESLADTTETLAAHLQGLMKKDIEHFADGVRSNGQDPGELRDRGLGGAAGFVDLVRLLAKAQERQAAGQPEGWLSVS